MSFLNLCLNTAFEGKGSVLNTAKNTKIEGRMSNRYIRFLVLTLKI